MLCWPPILIMMSHHVRGVHVLAIINPLTGEFISGKK